MRLIFICILVVVFLPVLAVGKTIKVPSDYPTIQLAVDAATSGDTILVAPGNYDPYQTSFKTLYIMSESGPEVTHLVGYVAMSIAIADLYYDSILDGFTIRNGGYYASPVQVYSSTVRNCIIRNNATEMSGGGINCSGDSKIMNNIICNNIASDGTAPDSKGGGIYVKSGNPVISNNTIYGNKGDYGGGVCVYSGAPTLTNNIVWGNSSTVNGDQMFPTSVNATYCNVEGGWPGTGNINANPLFYSPGSYDFHLKQDPCQPGVTNPCVDAGSDTAENLKFYTSWTRTDKAYDSGIVDMGFHYGTYPGMALYADVGVISQSVGAKVSLFLNGDTVNAGRNYLIFSGVTGTFPGFSPPPGLVTVPVNWDAFTNLALSLTNTTIFQDFYGVLDAQGKATAVFNTIGPFTGGVGITFNFAFALDLSYWDFASNATLVEVVP